jgi:putative copper export protein
MYRGLVLLHLLGASVWVGGHLVLAFTVLPRALRANDAGIVRDFEAGFERIGIPALLLQVVTGVLLALHWVPDVGTWFTGATPQARLVLAKLGCLAATIALAAHARLSIIPRLDETTLRPLAWHIRGVTGVAVAFVVLGVGIRTGGLF